MKSKVRIDWYQAVYKTCDQNLIKEFWKFFNCHKVSKNAAARLILIKYYSTTPAPKFIEKLLRLKQDIKLVKVNLYEMC